MHPRLLSYLYHLAFNFHIHIDQVGLFVVIAHLNNNKVLSALLIHTYLTACYWIHSSFPGSMTYNNYFKEDV